MPAFPRATRQEVSTNRGVERLSLGRGWRPMSGLKEFPGHRAEDENSHSLPEGSHGFVSEKRSASQIAEKIFLGYKTEKNPAGK